MIDSRISDVACGDNHTLVLDENGEIYAFGDNSRGQLGTGRASYKGIPTPKLVEELSFTKFVEVRAGQFSGAMSIDGQLFVWGEGVFGKYYTPKRLRINHDLKDF